MTIKTCHTGARCACLFFAVTALCAGEQKPAEKKKPAQDKAAAAKAKPRPEPAPLTLPAGAVETEPNTWTYTDPQGKKWIYRQTPFGLTRFEPRPPTAAELEQQKKNSELIRAFDDGDSVRFERPGPFGTYRWKKKKSELSPQEQAAWDRANGKHAGASEKQ